MRLSNYTSKQNWHLRRGSKVLLYVWFSLCLELKRRKNFIFMKMAEFSETDAVSVADWSLKSVPAWILRVLQTWRHNLADVTILALWNRPFYEEDDFNIRWYQNLHRSFSGVVPKFDRLIFVGSKEDVLRFCWDLSCVYVNQQAINHRICICL